MNPELPVQGQLDAYNKRDLHQFLSFYSKEVEVFRFAETTPYIIGRDQLEKVYAEVFANSPQLHAELVNRIVIGQKVLDQERVTGRVGHDLLEVVAIYDVVDGLIAKIWFLKA